MEDLVIANFWPTVCELKVDKVNSLWYVDILSLLFCWLLLVEFFNDTFGCWIKASCTNFHIYYLRTRIVTVVAFLKLSFRLRLIAQHGCRSRRVSFTRCDMHAGSFTVGAAIGITAKSRLGAASRLLWQITHNSRVNFTHGCPARRDSAVEYERARLIRGTNDLNRERK